MKKVNSRAKGARAEREAAKAVTEMFGVEARRGQQFSGIGESPDIVTGLKGIHFEIKHVQQLNLRAAYEQAERDAKNGDIPVVMHRRNKEDWFLTFKFKDVKSIIKLLKKY